MKSCPFCGEEPSFSGDVSVWHDLSRYVELSLECCAVMTERIGWPRARDMTIEERDVELRERLVAKWDRRDILDLD